MPYVNAWIDADSMQADTKAKAGMLNMLHLRLGVFMSLQPRSHTVCPQEDNNCDPPQMLSTPQNSHLTQVSCFAEIMAVFSQQKNLDRLWGTLLLVFAKYYST